ncbi:MAG: type II and III secretion system protein family protein [Acetobacteraceae bacterium]|nr:type II and III secretion system protein family protein [Acetobacteraceae bacterium]MBV8588531.1 type II and III secretion system protein family protein [Acetobacteraceae bacterium]
MFRLRLAGLGTLLAIALLAPVLAATPHAPASADAGRRLDLQAGGGKVLTLRSAATNVFVANPKIAQVQPASASSLFVFGVAPGRTTVAALDSDGQTLAEYEVTVHPSDFSAGEAQAAIARAIPGRSVRVHAQTKGLVVSGQVSTPEEAAQVLAVARGYLGEGQTLENQLAVQSAVQVTLKVRIAEMSRSVTRALGINWQAFGSSGRYAIAALAVNPLIAAATTAGASAVGFGTPEVNALIDALAQDNLARVLAEPNLTVMSGQPASFLAGGEFPIPVGQQNGQITIEFKHFGVKLDFVPTVLSSGRINLHVSPEVSELTNQGAVQLSAGNAIIQIPAINVRRAETTVELGTGQSFAIAGLLQDGVTTAGNGVPILGDLPVLGALFRSDNFQRKETELVIVVTPYIVRPVNDPAALHTPGEDYRPPSDLERILLLRQAAAGQPAVPVRIPGQAGFIVQ